MEQDLVGVFGGEEEGGGERECCLLVLNLVKGGPGEARTILLLHITSTWTSKQPLMQIKDIIIIC